MSVPPRSSYALLPPRQDQNAQFPRLLTRVQSKKVDRPFVLCAVSPSERREPRLGQETERPNDPTLKKLGWRGGIRGDEDIGAYDRICVPKVRHRRTSRFGRRDRAAPRETKIPIISRMPEKCGAFRTAELILPMKCCDSLSGLDAHAES